MNYRRWLIVGYMLVLMAFSASVLLIPGEKYDTLTTSDSGWVYDTAFEIDRTNSLAENNTLSHAPYGLTIPLSEQAQPLITVMLYRGLSVVNPSISLMDVVKYWAPFIFALSLIPIFLIAKELGGDLAGCAAAFFAATLVSSIYWNKVGAYDREPIQLLLGAWTMYITIKLFKAPRGEMPKFAVLAGLVYGLFSLSWAGALFAAAIVILGLLFVLLAGFLGKFLHKMSDVFGALFSAVRGHLDLIIGLICMMVVTTLAVWALGGQGPELWVGFFQTVLGYIGVGGGGGVSFSAYASEAQPSGTWVDTLSKFYNVNILTVFIFILVVLAIVKFLWSRKRWELLVLAWLIILAVMVWPDKGQARFERLWWPFVPAIAGVGAATLVSLAQKFSFDPSGEWLKALFHPLVLVLIAIIIATPFALNAYSSAGTTTPPTEWRARGLDDGYMDAFDWLRENTPENSVVSIQWSFGHLLTGTARRASVVDGAEVKGEQGKWENDPSFTPRPPDYIYYVEDSRGLIYGVDVSRESFMINGRRTDVQWFPIMGREEFEWYLATYRDNYGCKIDYVIFSIDEYSEAYNYYNYTQPAEIMLDADRISAPSRLEPTRIEGQKYTFYFGDNREAVVVDQQNQSVYLKTSDGNKYMDGYGVLYVNKQGRITSSAGYFPQSNPEIEETLILFISEDGSMVISAWLVEGVSAEITGRPEPVGMNIWRAENIDYLRLVFSSSNGYVKVSEIFHVPSLVSPATGAVTNDNTPPFQWTGAVGATRYELWVDNNSGFTSPEIRENNLSNLTHTSTESLADGNYWWRAGAYTAEDKFLGWSDVSTFVVDTRAPSQPQLSEPHDNAELSTLEAEFTWTEPEPGVTYNIQIDDEENFTSPYVHENTGVTDNSYTYTFPRNGVYYWRARAKDNAGNWSEWSSSFDVTVRAPPQAPALSSPENGVITNDNTPTLAWTGGNGDNYRLLLDNDPDFSSPNENILLSPSVTSFTIADENALLDDNYSWKVVAIVGDNENSSLVWTFVIDTQPPEAPALLEPENGATVATSTPTFKWSSSAGAENYNLVVYVYPDFPEIDVTLLENTYTSTEGLEADNYYWYVTAIDAAGNENASLTWVLILPPGV